MTYVISDLHGYPVKDFKRLLKTAGFGEEDECFVLGDVIDRGKEGAELLEWLLGCPNIYLILGNHEAMLLSCKFFFEEITDESVSSITADQLSSLAAWLSNGGQTTLQGLARMDKETRGRILEYLEEAPLYEQVTVLGQDYLLTHSGLGGYLRGRQIEDYTPEELLFNRPHPKEGYQEPYVTVFGHTPTHLLDPAYAGRVLFTDTWICIDTGSSFGMAPTLLRLEDRTQFRL